MPSNKKYIAHCKDIYASIKNSLENDPDFPRDIILQDILIERGYPLDTQNCIVLPGNQNAKLVIMSRGNNAMESMVFLNGEPISLISLYEYNHVYQEIIRWSDKARLNKLSVRRGHPL